MTRHPERWQIVSTTGIIALSVASSLLGLFRPGHYRDPASLLPQYYAQDATILLIGVPVLALGLRYAVNGSIRGYVVWLGGLAYMTYMWVSIGLQIAFNEFFLGYVVLFGLSLFTFIGGMVTVDADAVHRAVEDDVSEPVYSGFLFVIALGLATLWLAEIVPATLAGTAPLLVEEVGPQAMVSHFLDLSVVVPALVIAGGWLWQGRKWGYVFAGVGLVFGAILAPTITSTTLVVLLIGDVTVPLVAVVFTMLPLIVAAVLAIRYVLAAGEPETARAQ